MGGFLILILVIFGAVWVLFVLPARRRRALARGDAGLVAVGDEIITAGGIHGVVREIDDDGAASRSRPAWSSPLDRRAVAAVAREVEVESSPMRRRTMSRSSRCWKPSRQPSRVSTHRPGTRLTFPRLSSRRSHLFLIGLIVARPRRRWRSGRSRLAGPPWREEGPRPAGRPRGRAEGAAAEGPQAHLGGPRPLGRRSCGTASTSSASPSRDPQAGHRPDRDPARRRARPGAGGGDHRQDRAARALRPRARARSAVGRRASGPAGRDAQPLRPALARRRRREDRDTEPATCSSSPSKITSTTGTGKNKKTKHDDRLGEARSARSRRCTAIRRPANAGLLDAYKRQGPDGLARC